MGQRDAWKKALDPFDDLYRDMLTAYAVRMEQMTDEQLNELYRATRSPSQTNCGWTMYRAAPIVRDEVERERYRRKNGLPTESERVARNAQYDSKASPGEAP